MSYQLTKSGCRSLMIDIMATYEVNVQKSFIDWEKRNHKGWLKHVQFMKKTFGDMYHKSTKEPFGVQIKLYKSPYIIQIFCTKKRIGWKFV